MAGIILGCGPAADAGIDGHPGSDGGAVTVDGGAITSDGMAGDNGDDDTDARPQPENAFVYAHTDEALYRIDPDDLSFTLVGNFSGVENVRGITDIALDKDGNMYGVAFDEVYRIDPNTAAATKLSDLSDQLNSLSFVPDPDDPAHEILVAAADSGGKVLKIDPMTGATTEIGNYGDDGGALDSSGDIVYVKDLGILATVTVGGSETDYLIRVDPQTFQGTVIGDTGFVDVFGLGFWGNQVYGFTDESEFILIDLATGKGTLTEAPALRWWGAGVTTRAVVSPE
ncbi:MAG TPA: hypothetical protein VFG83_04045 [Kofleriaceae bacterium]|nr:hypothetical protein [Kofleriaceae bacterium]